MNMQEKIEMLNGDIELIKKELKRIASTKSRLKKQKGKASYAQELEQALLYESMLKELRDSLVDKPKTVPQYTQEDVDALSYDDTIKALRSIQSKKSLSRWLTPIEGDNDEYRNARRVESMLIERRDALHQPKSKVKLSIIEDILNNSDALSKEDILQMLLNAIE